MTKAAGAFAFPIMVEVRGIPVFVAGGGREARTKARALADLGAIVRFWTREWPDNEVAGGGTGSGRIEARSGNFDPHDLVGARLAIVDTGDRALDRTIAQAARDRGVLVNTVDDVPGCDWSAPAILRRGALTVTVATGGVAPAVAVRVRDAIGAAVGPEYGALLEVLADVRPRIAASGRSFSDRRRLWYALADGPALALLRDGLDAEALATIDTQLAQWEASE